VSRHRHVPSRPSRGTLYAAAGTLAIASVAAAVIAAGPTLLGPSASDHPPFGASADLSLARHPRVAPAKGEPQQVIQGDGQSRPENPALIVRQAMNKRLAAHLLAVKHAAAARRAAEVAARRAAEQARTAAEGRRQAAAQGTAMSGTPQQIAMAMLASYGWSSREFSCLNSLWEQESGWNPYASNPSSGAYGIPQALPGSKMASAGPDWQNDPATQIRWGLGYIKGTYGSPCAALSHESSAGWY
jgi:transglycosylase-like protein with SLT domain